MKKIKKIKKLEPITIEIEKQDKHPDWIMGMLEAVASLENEKPEKVEEETVKEPKKRKAHTTRLTKGQLMTFEPSAEAHDLWFKGFKQEMDKAFEKFENDEREKEKKKKKTADELFGKLGYWNITDESKPRFIKYRNDETIITMWGLAGDGYAFKVTKGWNGEVDSITNKQLKAIRRKAKEMGWR